MFVVPAELIYRRRRGNKNICRSSGVFEVSKALPAINITLLTELKKLRLLRLVDLVRQ